MPVTRRAYAGGAIQTTISGSIADDASSITIDDDTGWPSGAPFYVVIDPGQPAEEKVLVTRSGTTLTVADVSTDRGVDGTAAAAHPGGAEIYPVITARDLDEANLLASRMTTRGDIIYQGASDPTRLAKGTQNLVLRAGANDPEWGQVVAASIATGAVEEAKIASAAVTTAKIADANVTEAKLVAALVEKLVPAGTLVATLAAAEPTGYKFMDGQTLTNAQTTFPAAWSALPTAWRSGSNIVLPDWRGKTLFGQRTSDFPTLGGTVGANTKTIATENLPAHTHTIDHGHTATTNSTGSHTHGPGTGEGSPTANRHVVSSATDGTNVVGVSDGGTALYLQIDSATASAGAHSHTVTVASHSGASGSTGSGTALNVVPEAGVVNWAIKVH